MNSPDNEGQTPVGFAAEEGCADVIRTLVELGANVNIPDNDGCSPLHAASWGDFMGIVWIQSEP